MLANKTQISASWVSPPQDPDHILSIIGQAIYAVPDATDKWDSSTDSDQAWLTIFWRRLAWEGVQVAQIDRIGNMCFNSNPKRFGREFIFRFRFQSSGSYWIETSGFLEMSHAFSEYYRIHTFFIFYNFFYRTFLKKFISMVVK